MKFLISKKADLLFIALFFLLPLILYKNIILGKSFFWDDALHLFYPQRNFAAVSFSKGIFPFWNPYIFGGMPFMPDIQTALFYPFTLLLTLFVKNGVLNWWIIQYYTIFHITLAGIFMYFLMNYLLHNRFAAFISGISFMFTTQLVLRSVQPVVLNSMVWLPIIFYYAIRAIEEKSYKFAILGGILWAVALFSGYPQFVFMSALLVVSYFLYRSKSKKVIISLCLFLGIGVGSSAVQLLPTQEFSKYSTRAEWTYEQMCENSVRPIRYITLLIPKFFGTVTGKGDITFRLADEGYWTYWEQGMYIGILTLILGILGVIIYRKEPNVKFFFFASILMLWIALGKYGGIYKIFYYLPIFNKFRGPSKFLYFFEFGMSALAGYGIKAFLENIVHKSIYKVLYITIGGCLFISILAFGFNLPPTAKGGFTWFILFLILSLIIFYVIQPKSTKLSNKPTTYALYLLTPLIILFDLFYANWGSFEGAVHPGKHFSDPNRLIQFLESQPGHFRVNAREGRQFLLFPRNQGCFNPIFTLQGLTPLHLNCFDEFMAGVNNPKKFDLFNIKYKIIVDSVNYRLLLGPHDSYLPRAKIYHKVVLIPERDKIIPYINSDEFNHNTTLILEKEPGIVLPESLNEISSSARIVKYGLNEILVETNSTANGMLFLSEIFYPAWRAWVDDKECEILCANYTFRAVPVEAGKHIVKFIYKSTYFTIGRTISLITLLFAIGLLKRFKRVKGRGFLR